MFCKELQVYHNNTASARIQPARFLSNKGRKIWLGNSHKLKQRPPTGKMIKQSDFAIQMTVMIFDKDATNFDSSATCNAPPSKQVLWNVRTVHPVTAKTVAPALKTTDRPTPEMPGQLKQIISTSLLSQSSPVNVLAVLRSVSCRVKSLQHSAFQHAGPGISRFLLYWNSPPLRCNFEELWVFRPSGRRDTRKAFSTLETYPLSQHCVAMYGLCASLWTQKTNKRKSKTKEAHRNVIIYLAYLRDAPCSRLLGSLAQPEISPT